jgi:threonine dehydratase
MTGVDRPTAGEVEKAAALLTEVIQVTPLVPLRAEGADGIRLKVELHQPGGCFKIRGVYHAVARMDPERRARGLSTVSAGNTAKALAWAGRAFGVEARSLMPDHAPKTKVEAVRALGGTPVLRPVEEVFAFLKEHRWEDEPYAFVHPWTDRDVMTGHGTLALEILAQLPEVETVYVPVGGGGLLGGVGSALKALKPTVRIVAVEPAGCPSLHAAIEAGEPVEVQADTMCDGVAVPYITHEMFPLLRELADETALVSEGAVREMIAILAMENHLVAEGSGALAAAAALAADPKHRENAVALVTGGSIDAAVLAEILTPR